MDDRYDIEMTTAELKYIINHAQFKVGDVVHTWYNEKCIVGTVINVVCIGEAIYYDVDFGTCGRSELMEELLIKTGHTSVDMDSFAPVLF